MKRFSAVLRFFARRFFYHFHFFHFSPHASLTFPHNRIKRSTYCFTFLYFSLSQKALSLLHLKYVMVIRHRAEHKETKLIEWTLIFLKRMKTAYESTCRVFVRSHPSNHLDIAPCEGHISCNFFLCYFLSCRRRHVVCNISERLEYK